MPDISTATIDQNIKPNPFSLREELKPNIPKQPEQDTGTLPGLQYGIILSWRTESPTANIDLHDTDKNIIRVVLSRDLLKRFYVTAQPEDNRVLHPSTLNTEPLTANVDLEHTDKSMLLSKISERLAVIAQREDNWDGHESKKPIELSLDRAKRLMEKLLDTVISGGHSWLAPFISSDEDGYITVEWYGKERQLHLRIEEDEVEYIKLQRTNTQREVHVEAIRSDDCFALWKWLIYG